MALFWTYAKGLQLAYLGKNQRMQDSQMGHFNHKLQVIV